MKNPQEFDNRVPKGIFGRTGSSIHIKIEPVDVILFSEFLAGKWENKPDALYLADCSKLIGYDKETLLRWCQTGDLGSINYYGKLLVAKAHLVEIIAIKVNTDTKTNAILSSLIKDYKKRLSKD